MATRRAPAKLGAKAAKFWRDTTKNYELSAHEALILEGACRELDIIDRLDAELEGANLIVTGSQGQEIANPLLGEVRMHRAAFATFIRQLDLPEVEDDKPMSPRSRQAQAAANARWGRAG